MSIVLAALLPVLSLIFVGWVLRQRGFPGDGFWRPAARMVYFVFLPALLVRIIALAELDPSVWKAQVAAAGTVAILFIVLLLTRNLVTGSDGPAFTSVVQGSVRHNTYIGLAIANVLFTANQVASFALIVAVIVPLVNGIAVVVLGIFGKNAQLQQVSAVSVAKLVARNPLIIACALGAVLNLTGVKLPFGTEGLFRLLGQPALPIGLLVVGAGLRVSALREISMPVVVPILARLFAYPVLAVWLGHHFGVQQEHIAPLALLGALPTAASAYVLALELGGDEDLMARIITVETLIAALTLPLVLTYLI